MRHGPLYFQVFSGKPDQEIAGTSHAHLPCHFHFVFGNPSDRAERFIVKGLQKHCIHFQFIQETPDLFNGFGIIVLPFYDRKSYRELSPVTLAKTNHVVPLLFQCGTLHRPLELLKTLFRYRLDLPRHFIAQGKQPGIFRVPKKGAVLVKADSHVFLSREGDDVP